MLKFTCRTERLSMKQNQNNCENRVRVSHIDRANTNTAVD